MVIIGGGDGSFDAARRLLKSLPSNFPAGMLLHLTPAAIDKAGDPLQLLRPHSSLPLLFASHGEAIPRNCVRIVPTGFTAEFGVDGKLNVEPLQEQRARPIDRLLKSGAAVFGRQLISVLLSGAGDDGTAGLRATKEAGGTSIVQSPSDSANAGMPVHALIGDQPDRSALVQQIGPLLVQFAHRLAE